MWSNHRDVWPFYLSAAAIFVAFADLYQEPILATLRTFNTDKNFEIFIVTLLAAWAGGTAAFRGDRSARKREETKKQIANVNRAIFNIAQMYEAYTNLRRFYIAPHNTNPEDPVRALHINSPQPNMVRPIRFAFDDLVFLLGRTDTGAPKALQDLIRYEGDYENLRQTIEQRAAARQELMNVVAANAIPNLQPSGYQAQYPIPFNKLLGLTDQLVDIVNDGIETTPEMYRIFHGAMIEVLGGIGIQKLAFADPNAPVAPDQA